MSPELRVVLSLWLNAYENFMANEKIENDTNRIRSAKRVLEELQAISEDLYLVADDEVDNQDPASWAKEKIITGPPKREGEAAPRSQLKHSYALPHPSKMPTIIAALAEWHEAGEGVYDVENPTRSAYTRMENAEAALRHIITTCARRANEKFQEFEVARIASESLREVAPSTAADLAALAEMG